MLFSLMFFSNSIYLTAVSKKHILFITLSNLTPIMLTTNYGLRVALHYFESLASVHLSRKSGSHFLMHAGRIRCDDKNAKKMEMVAN